MKPELVRPADSSMVVVDHNAGRYQAVVVQRQPQRVDVNAPGMAPTQPLSAVHLREKWLCASSKAMSLCRVQKITDAHPPKSSTMALKQRPRSI
jgi:hypothetical protein